MTDGLPEERRPENHNSGLEEVEEAKTAEPSTVDRVIEAHRKLNRGSFEVLRRATAKQRSEAGAMFSGRTSSQPRAIVELLENQKRVSKVLSAFETPLPGSFCASFADIHRLNGLAKVMEDAQSPSHWMRGLANSFLVSGIGTNSLEAVLLKSARQSALANSLDTTASRMFADIKAHTSAIERITTDWRRPVWDDIKITSQKLERLRALAVTDKILENGFLERFNTVRLLRVACRDENPDYAREASRVIALSQYGELDTIERALESVDPRLVKAWAGAKEALKSGNPDRSRHMASSLRGLIENLLRSLAPDRAVRAWSTSPSDYHEERPTRAARIRYIYSRYGHEMQDLLEPEVRATVRWMDVVSKEIHILGGFETDEAMEALLARFEGIVLSLIRGAKGFE